MKKSLLILILSVGILNINAQCKCEQGINSQSTFTYQTISYTISYIDCGNGIPPRITNIVANGNSVKGKLTFLTAIQGFFKHNSNFKEAQINASCKQWVQNGKTLNPNPVDNNIFLVSYTLQDCNTIDACCTFVNNGGGMVESSLNEGVAKEVCNDEQYCFPICEEY